MNCRDCIGRRRSLSPTPFSSTIVTFWSGISDVILKGDSQVPLIEGEMLKPLAFILALRMSMVSSPYQFLMPMLFRRYAMLEKSGPMISVVAAFGDSFRTFR